MWGALRHHTGKTRYGRNPAAFVVRRKRWICCGALRTLIMLPIADIWCKLTGAEQQVASLQWMKEIIMKNIGALLLAALLCFSPYLPQALSEEIAPNGNPLGGAPTDSAGSIGGVVQNTQGSPVEGVVIIALQEDENGNDKVIARAVTNANGEYTLGCLPPGEYKLQLDAMATGFQGQMVKAGLSSAGSTVNWNVSTANQAIALAKDQGPGVCNPAGGVELKTIVGYGLGTAIIGGIVYGTGELAGAWDGDDSGGMRSPSQ
jgi:5-hydroxyisourate hydrolase-like protein (transthyretin family)